MRFFSTLSTVLAAAVALAAAPSQAQTFRPLPFDGRIQSLTLDNIGDTYLLHIFKMRPNNTVGNPADYLSIDQTGRKPAYNGDTGVVSVAVDDKAIFKEMYNFRRSELVQFVDGNANGTTVFRASLRADEEIQNKYKWQVFFPETHIWEVFVDASQSPPQLQLLADGSTVQFQLPFRCRTWYNVAVAVEASGLISFFLSEGQAPVVPVAKTKTPLASVPANYELHFGMLYYSPTNNPPMVANHQDKLLFNGVTVDTKL